MRDRPAGSRRLAAVLSADAAGYSRLLVEDEAGTLAQLERCRRILREESGAHGGRVVDAVGDNLLAVFESAVDAVQAALEAQERIAREGEAAPEERGLRLRMGIHLGDLLVEGERVVGDGVNVAARIEAHAEPGRVCVSEIVLEQLRGRLEVEAVDLGAPPLKNIRRPIRLFRIARRSRARGTVAREAEDPAPPTSGGAPSIAVLPFADLSQAEDRAYLAQGITEDLISMLGCTPGLRVIARTSSVACAAAGSDVRRIARDLDVAYVVEGSVRQRADRLRISARLVEGGSGAQLWTERFEGPLEQLFELQDDVVARLVAQLPTRVVRAEAARCARSTPESLDTWSLYHRAYDAFYLRARHLGEISDVRDLLRRALEREPAFPPALALRAVIATMVSAEGLSAAAETDLAQAVADGEAALRAAPDDPVVLRAWATVQRAVSGPHASIPILERVLELNPNDTQARAALGVHSAIAGDPGAGLENVERAMELSPRDPQLWVWHQFRGNMLLQLDRPQEALEAVERSLLLYPDSPVGLTSRAALRMRLGLVEQAREAVGELRRRYPQASLALVEAVLKGGGPLDDRLRKEIVELLRHAGLE